MSASIAADFCELVKIRHELHSNPEISLCENWTAAFVTQRLNAMGIPVHTYVGGYGLVGVIDGTSEGPSIALRADMDALEIQEQNQFAYASRRSGVMHACGHDGHMTILLGAAAHLSRTRRFRGTIYLVFQPAEEGHGGAQLMVDGGLFNRFPAQRIFGLHNWPDLTAGDVVVHDGPVMAGADEFVITFMASGGHAAMPHLTGDPLLAGSQFVTGIQQAVARATDPLDAAVVTVASFKCEAAQNIISDRATLSGTFRGQTRQTIALLRSRIEAVAASAAAMAGASVDIAFATEPSPPVVNSPAEAEIMRQAARRAGLVSRTGIRPSMAADDFGTFLDHLPGAYAWIGNGPSEKHGRLHQPNYDFNDEIIMPAVLLMAATAELALAWPFT